MSTSILLLSDVSEVILKESNLRINFLDLVAGASSSIQNHPIVGFSFSYGNLVYQLIEVLVVGLTYGGLFSSLSVLFYIPVSIGLIIFIGIIFYFAFMYCYNNYSMSLGYYPNSFTLYLLIGLYFIIFWLTLPF